MSPSFRSLALLGAAVMTLAAGENNPFFRVWKTPFGAPPFHQIKEAHFAPAFAKAMAEHRAEIQKLLANPQAPTFQNTIQAYDDAGQLLSKVQGVFFNLTEAHTTDALQAVAQEMAPKLAAHRDDLALDPKLFARVKAVHDQAGSLRLTAEQRFMLDKVYRDMVRGGALLAGDKQARLRAINGELSVAELKFSENLLKETNAFTLVVDRKEDLAGLPESLIASAADDAKAAGKAGSWVFTLKAPSLWPFLQYSENRSLRQKLLAAYAARGSQGNAQDNLALVARITALRAEKAQLLGFATWAHYMLDDRMAKTPEKVDGLLRQVWEPARAKAQGEAADLQAMIDAGKGGFKLEAADWRFYAEKVKKAKFDLDEHALAPYFALDKVRDGAFYVAKRLYGITFKQRKDIPTYHSEVQVFEVKERSGKALGLLYMDFHPRATKRGGAWCLTFRDGQIVNGKETLPLVINVSNYTRPSGSVPALLTPDEASTLFHEFGHALHALFTRVRYRGLANAVPMDFVELPSQVMEHWAMAPEVLKVYAKHYKTGEPLPEEQIARIQKAGTFNQGFITTEFTAAAMLDMAWHTQQGTTAQDTLAFEKNVAARIGLPSEILFRYRSPYFAHMIGEYSAGYYSYLWSAVLDADAFEAFKEKKDLFHPATAAAFRREILAKGGAGDPATMYRAFRGKDPSVEPLLKHRGLK